MRKEYGQVLRKLFPAAMATRLPQFAPFAGKSMYLWPGERAFCHDATPTLRLWIVLSPSAKDRDEFTVLIGWSRLQRYPELSMIPCAQRPAADRAEFAREEYLTRLPFLYGNVDQWWVVKPFKAAQSTEELAASLEPVPAAAARAAVEPQVANAVNKLCEHALPYFAALAAA